jgi:cytochrome P450
VLNFLIAGRDTTALLLSWFFYQLADHPDIEARIIAEMDTVLSEEGEVTFDSMKRLVYLQQVIQESLRIYPSVPFNGFTALKDDVLPGGYFVPKDTYVVYSAYILHRRPDLFPDPLTFDPDRFERKPPKPFEYMAFHGGPRECLGREMAFLEAKIMIVTLLGRFRMRMHPTAKVELKRAIILTARRGVRMKLEITPQSPYQSQPPSQQPTPAPTGSPRAHDAASTLDDSANQLRHRWNDAGASPVESTD